MWVPNPVGNTICIHVSTNHIVDLIPLFISIIIWSYPHLPVEELVVLVEAQIRDGPLSFFKAPVLKLTSPISKPDCLLAKSASFFTKPLLVTVPSKNAILLT